MSGILKLNTPSTLIKDYLKMDTPTLLGQPAEAGILTYYGEKLKLSLGSNKDKGVGGDTGGDVSTSPDVSTDTPEGINWYNLVTENLATNIAVATVSQDMQSYMDARYRINHPLNTKNVIPTLYIGNFLHNEKIHSFETEDSSNVVISFETSINASGVSTIRLVLVGQQITKDASWVQSLPPSGGGSDPSSNQELVTGGNSGNDTSTGDVSTNTGNENTEPDKDNGEGGDVSTGDVSTNISTGNENTEPDKDNGEGGETGGDTSTGDGDDPDAQSKT